MKFNTLLLALGCTAGFFACQKRQAPPGTNTVPVTTIRWDVDSLRPLSDYIENIELIPLENISEAAFATVDQITYRDHRYYILDRYGSNKLLAFDDKGNFIRSFGRKGRGPGEYVALQSVSFKADTLLLLDRIGAKLIMYDTTGTYIGEVKMNTKDASQAVWLSDGFMFYHPLYQEEPIDNTVELWKTDAKGLHLHNYFMYHQQSSRASYAAPITESDSTMILNRYCNDTLIVFDRRGNIREALFWDFGKYAMPQQLRLEVNLKENNYNRLSSTVFPVGPFLTGTAMNRNKLLVFLYNPQNRQIYIDPTGKGIPALPSNRAAKDSTAIVSWLSYDMKDKFVASLGEDRMSKILPALENGQVFLVVYHLKNDAL